MPTPDALSDIVLADRLTDANQRRIRGTSNLQVSWQLSGAGMLTCDVTLRDLRQAGLGPSGLMGKWLHYEHPTAGPWGGVITSVRAGDGLVGIGAESWAAEYRGKSTYDTGFREGYLGVALHLQIDHFRADTGIRLGSLDFSSTSGGDLPIEADFLLGGQDFYEQFLPSVLDRWNAINGWRVGLQAAGWNVDPVTRRFNFDPTYGRDLSGSVALRDGRHSVGSEWADDMTDIINDVSITAQVNTTWTQSAWGQDRNGTWVLRTITGSQLREATGRADNLASVHRYGRRMLHIDHEAIFPNATRIGEAAFALAQMYGQNQQLVTTRIADVDGIYRLFREGDIVWAWLANGDAAGKMVVRHRALDVGRGVMTVSGEANLS